MSTGKIVTRVEVGATSEYGRLSNDTVLVHFTDGTALRIVGSSYDEVSQSVDEIDRRDVLALARRAQGRRERERVQGLAREAAAALPKEERDRREAQRREKLSPLARACEDQMRSLARNWLSDINLAALAGNTIALPVHTKKRARRS